MRTVACFGDSLIYGFPFGPRYSWLAQAEALTGHKFLNYGVCGDCCDDILERLRRMYLPTQATHILFWGGANDIIQMRPLKFILEDLQKTLVYCQSSKLELGLVLPLLTAESGLNEYLSPLREAVSSNFAGKASLFDLQPAIGLGKKQLQAAFLDSVHPTAATYGVLGTYAAPLLDTWLSHYNCK